MAAQNLFDKNISDISDEEARQVWIKVAQEFAREASGDINAALDDPKPEGLFLSVELPVLREGLVTGRITSITLDNLADGTRTVLTAEFPGPGGPAVAILSARPTQASKPGRRWFGRADRSTLRFVRPQLVEHPDGWSVGNNGRWTVEYEAAGRLAQVDVDRGVQTVVYASSLRWVAPDGTESPLNADDLARVRPRLVEGIEALGMAPAIYD